MRHIQTLHLSACLLLFFLHGNAQSKYNNLDTLTSRFITNLHNADKEKIMLQTDRKVYAAGERVWFKAFLLRTLDNGLDTVSKNLFVDLVNKDDKTFGTLVLNVERQRTNGALTIPDSLPSGYYWLRCYTQQIIKYDRAGVFLQPLYVFNTRRPTNSDTASLLTAQNNTKVINADKPVIHFYPEGGAMITGMVSGAALQVTDATGNPLSISGRVVINKDSTIQNFTTNKFGLAGISFYPKWFDKYAIIINAHGANIKYPLTVYKPFAARLSVTGQNEAGLKTVVALEDSIYSKDFTTYLIAISRDRVCFESVGKGMYEVYVPTGNFPGGIATFLLFDENQHLLSERNVFINKSNYTINIQTDKQVYAARDNVRMAIDVNDGKGRPLFAALNIAVQTEKIQQASDEVETDTLLPASISVNDWIESRRSDYSQTDIDLLMLTQPYDYKNWAADSIKRMRPVIDETGLLTSLYGKITDRKGRLMKDFVVTAITKQGAGFFFDVDTTNSEGGFKLHIPQEVDSLSMQLQVSNTDGKVQDQAKITVDNFAFPHVATPAFLAANYATPAYDITKRLVHYHVDTVLAKAGKDWLTPVTVHTITKKQEDYDVTKRINPFSHIITNDMINVGGVNSINNALIMIPGVSLKGRYIAFFGGGGGGSAFGAGASSEPIVVMDGIEIPVIQMYPPYDAPIVSPVMNFLNSLNPADIDFIEVLTGADAGIYGVRGGHGAIVINTKTRNNNVVDAGKGLKIVTPVTYHVSPQFKMPDYADKAVKDSKTPDPRITIYWDGNVVTDLNGKASLHFYTADEPSTYVVTITGITANGDYISKRIAINRK